MKMLFWGAAFFILYTYFGYPLLLCVWRKIATKPVLKRPSVPLPTVSVILVGRNEEQSIRRRLENLYQQTFPAELMEIILVSDGSTDAMTAHARNVFSQYHDNAVASRIVELEKPSGKAVGLNAGVAAAAGEILVFADCRQIFDKQAVAELVNNFADPNVGCVSGELVFLKDDSGAVQEMGAYWNYEKAIRRLESATGSVIGATGAIYAIRKNLYQPHHSSIVLDDVVTPLQILHSGLRVVFDDQAIAYDRVSVSLDKEWQRKIRTLTGNWQILSLHPKFLNPGHPHLLFRLLSHKIARLLVPHCMIAILAASLSLVHSIYALALVGQIVFYLIAASSIFGTFFLRYPLVRLCRFVCVLNAAAFMSFWYWILGRSSTLWQRR